MHAVQLQQGCRHNIVTFLNFYFSESVCGNSSVATGIQNLRMVENTVATYEILGEI
jgi:hypothetical protein